MSDVDRFPLPPDGPLPVTHPVAPVVRLAPSQPAPRGAWRSLVALLTTAVMVLGTLGVAAFAGGGRALAAEGPTFLPADAVAYAEARLDLPSDQRDQLMAFLGHFPGFADQASFDGKLDQALDQLLAGQDAPISWTGDIRPWFSGQVLYGLPAIPETADPAAPTVGVIALGVTDRDALEAALAKLLDPMGDAVVTEPHGGTTISTVTGRGGSPTVLAPTDTLLLISNDIAQVRAALSILASDGDSLDEDPAFQAAMAGMPADRLAAFVLDTRQLAMALGQALRQQMDTTMPGAAMAQTLEAALASMPQKVTGYLRVEADHLVARFDAITGVGSPSLLVRATDLAARMPAGTMVFLEERDLGQTLGQVVGQLKSMMEQSVDSDSLEVVEAVLGSSLETYLDWVGDAALGIGLGPESLSVGLVAAVTDEAVADERLDALVALVRIASATAEEPPIKVTSEDVDGTTVVTFTLADPAELPRGIPIEPSLSVALADAHLYLGLGDFVEDALARDPAASLAADAGYQRALAALGGEHAGMVYVDLASALLFLELTMGSDARERFQEQVKPYTDVLDSFVAGLGQDADSAWASLMLFVE